MGEHSHGQGYLKESGVNISRLSWAMWGERGRGEEGRERGTGGRQEEVKVQEGKVAKMSGLYMEERLGEAQPMFKPLQELVLLPLHSNPGKELLHQMAALCFPLYTDQLFPNSSELFAHVLLRSLINLDFTFNAMVQIGLHFIYSKMYV